MTVCDFNPTALAAGADIRVTTTSKNEMKKRIKVAPSRLLY
jgi:hypothetical protein